MDCAHGYDWPIAWQKEIGLGSLTQGDAGKEGWSQSSHERCQPPSKQDVQKMR